MGKFGSSCEARSRTSRFASPAPVVLGFKASRFSWYHVFLLGVIPGNRQLAREGSMTGSIMYTVHVQRLAK